MSEKYKNLEGSFPVNGDVTPISHQPIEQIDSSLWEDMTIGELVNQRIALNDRINRAQMMGLGGVAQQMQRGLIYLDSLITQKQETQETHLR